MSETLKFESKITHFENVNPLFSRVKIRIAYTGLNRNNSFISKETFEKAIPTIYLCPIVGEYNQSIEDFRGHGGKLEITDDSIKWITTTQAYGVIDTNSEITWEEVIEDDGKVKDYICATGYLWTGRYPELNSVIENSKSQSMEIEINSGEFQEIDGVKSYAISDFTFSGFCILGDDIEPCFESSTISSYSLDKFKQDFNQMMKELKFSLSNENTVEVITINNPSEEWKCPHCKNFIREKELYHDGDNWFHSPCIEKGNIILPNKDESGLINIFSVPKEGGKDVLEQVIEMLKKYSLSIEDLTEKEIDYEQFTSVDDLEAKVQEVFKAPDEFALTHEQLESELRREIGGIEVMADPYWEDYTYPRYNLVDFKYDQGIAVAYDCKEGYLVGLNYTVTADNVEADSGSIQRYKIDFLPMDLSSDIDEVFSKKKFNLVHSDIVDHRVKVKEFELQKQIEEVANTDASKEELDRVTAEFAALQEKFAALETKATEMETKLGAIAQEEKQIAEDALFEKFATKLTEEDMAKVKENKVNMSLEDMEKELALVFSRKMITFSVNYDAKPLRVSLPIDNKPSSDKPYADMIESRRKSD